MLQNRLVALDRLVLPPAAGLGDFVEGKALHTSRGSAVRRSLWRGEGFCDLP